MTKEQITKALAVVDGWNEHCTSVLEAPWGITASKPKWNYLYQLPRYTESYDAIMPLIQKQSEYIKGKVCFGIWWKSESTQNLSHADRMKADMSLVLSQTPAELCEVLLRALRMWIE